MTSLIQEEVILTIPNGRALGPSANELNINIIKCNQLRVANLTPAGAVYNDINGNLFSGPVVSSVSMAGDVTGNTSSNTVAFVGGKSAASVSQSVDDTVAATSISSPSTIVKRDINSSFASNSVAANQLDLPFTVNNSTGTIRLGSSRFIHGYGITSTFVGRFSGNYTFTGSQHTGIGHQALTNLSTGERNTAVGYASAQFNTVGNDNTACGWNSLNDSLQGNFNSAFGSNTLSQNRFGNNNTAIGYNNLAQGVNASDNTIIGANCGNSLTDGNNNVIIGSGLGNSLTNGNNNIYISGISVPFSDENNTIRIGNSLSAECQIGGISGSISPAGSGVLVSANGTLGTIVSSRKYKRDIYPITNSENIYSLNPVSFTYKSDEGRKIQYGLIAEEVNNYYPELVIKDNFGGIQSLRYDFLHALMLKELQKQKLEIINLSKKISILEGRIN